MAFDNRTRNDRAVLIDAICNRNVGTTSSAGATLDKTKRDKHQREREEKERLGPIQLKDEIER
jgi:hypothetical protein